MNSIKAFQASNAQSVNKRLEAERLVDIWLDGLCAASREAGWDGESMLCRFIEFGGAPPKGTGMDQSNLSMIIAIDKMKGTHHSFHMIDKIIRRLLKNTQTARHILALLTKQYYQGLNPETDKTYNREDKAILWSFHCADLGLMTLCDKTFEQIESGYRWGSERCAPRLIWREVNYTG